MVIVGSSRKQAALSMAPVLADHNPRQKRVQATQAPFLIETRCMGMRSRTLGIIFENGYVQILRAVPDGWAS